MHLIKHAAEINFKFGARMVAVSSQTPDATRHAIESNQLPFEVNIQPVPRQCGSTTSPAAPTQVLCDKGLQLATKMNLTFQLSPGLQKARGRRALPARSPLRDRALFFEPRS